LYNTLLLSAATAAQARRPVKVPPNTNTFANHPNEIHKLYTGEVCATQHQSVFDDTKQDCNQTRAVWAGKTADMSASEL
jgi:hypothetical protein